MTPQQPDSDRSFTTATTRAAALCAALTLAGLGLCHLAYRINHPKGDQT